MTGGDVDYPLDELTPARHVATVLSRTGSTGSTVGDMAATYRADHGDLSRIIYVEEGITSNAEATRWLIQRAVSALQYRGSTSRSAVQLEEVDGRWRLKVPVNGLRFHGAQIKVIPEPSRFDDPTQAVVGRYAGGNVRTHGSGKDLAELRESMRVAGWLPGNRAVRDERGTVLTGHRRMAVAAELGIPVRPGIEVEDITFGDGDDADAKRLQQAILSNTGQAPFSKEEKVEIAQYLYRDRGWSQTNVAEALSVSQPTVARLLDSPEVIHVNNLPERTDARGHKGNTGRPRKVIAAETAVLAIPDYDDPPPLSQEECEALDEEQQDDLAAELADLPPAAVAQVFTPVFVPDPVDQAIDAFPGWLAQFGVTERQFDQRRNMRGRVTS